MLSIADPVSGKLAPLSHAYARAFAGVLGYTSEHHGKHHTLTLRPQGVPHWRVEGTRGILSVRTERGGFTVWLEADPSPEDYGYPAPAVGVSVTMVNPIPWDPAEIETLLVAAEGLPCSALILPPIRVAAARQEVRHALQK